ncbi:hypothetical protein [Nonomuraea candida]|uniref:hypothetical protein n=1 Tax=Nonomuraea candida TaxID=359159 RepID=UPI0005BAC9AD|nr:hypothetical protein [Nonomuraea candida]
MRHRPARLFTTALLTTTLPAAALTAFALAGPAVATTTDYAPGVAVASTPVGGLTHRAHRIRDAVIEAGSRFYGLADILTGVSLRDALPI